MSNDEIFGALRKRLPISEKRYKIVRTCSARMCHDTVPYLPDLNRMLLAIRKQEPARRKSWPFGGWQKIGFSQRESLARLVKDESGIDIQYAEPFERPLDMFWSTGPKEMGLDGIPVHDVAQYYTTIGRGEINPNNVHSFRLISPEDYLREKESMEFWTRVGMDRAANKFWRMNVEEMPFPLYLADSKPIYEKQDCISQYI
ncbi:hypothetical protein COU59_01840 [Candidatus Pacearchaeota archaeon CG10_big_fil_rev_8_21_14_0_10_34_12]|nr:MAG: hypothetical protein COU59_01840 [Candidatus Pacearchaeota archaeon CG10_big_fil_rev_8_21_14_0_10_34_12]